MRETTFTMKCRKAEVIDKTALVYGQMNEPPGARMRMQVFPGLPLHFRDVKNQDVLLFIDNIFFRFTRPDQRFPPCLDVCRQQ